MMGLGCRGHVGLGVPFAIGLLAIVVPLPAAPHSLDSVQDDLYRKERYFQIKDRPAPEFAIRDPDGKLVGLADLRGKIVILNFIYASCPDVCPMHSEKIAEVQEMIGITPMKDQVRFVTITTDPERDTPEVLRAYGALHGLDPANWVFLTSGGDQPEDSTRRIAERFGHRFTKTDDGTQMHGIVTHVIDQQGVWRANFHGLKFNSTNLVIYVNALINDAHGPAQDDHSSEPSFWDRIWSLF